MIKFLFAAAVGLFLSVGSAAASGLQIIYQFIQESVTRTGNPPPNDPDLDIFNDDIFDDIENSTFRAYIRITAPDSIDLDNIHADAEWGCCGGYPFILQPDRWNGARFDDVALAVSSPRSPLVGRWGGNVSIVDTILDDIQINGQLRDHRYYPVMGRDEFVYSTVDFGPSMIRWSLRQYFSEGAYEMSYEVKGRWERTSVSPVPLPASLPLLLGGIATLTALRYRGRKTAAA